jgi:hypothetical protein
MARKPNYKFERLERDRLKAAKKAARLEAKKERQQQKDDDSPVGESSDSADGVADATE